MKFEKEDFVKSTVHHPVTPGEALKIIRELQGFSQAELERKTGIAQSNISAIENGTSQLGRDRAIVFAKVLKVHPSVLLFPDFDMAEVA